MRVPRLPPGTRRITLPEVALITSGSSALNPAPALNPAHTLAPRVPYTPSAANGNLNTLIVTRSVPTPPIAAPIPNAAMTGRVDLAPVAPAHNPTVGIECHGSPVQVEAAAWQRVAQDSRLVADDGMVALQGSCAGTWAAVDDWRRLVGRLIDGATSARVGFFVDELLYLVVEYVGCQACDDPAYREYRQLLLKIPSCADAVLKRFLNAVTEGKNNVLNDTDVAATSGAPVSSLVVNPRVSSPWLASCCDRDYCPACPLNDCATFAGKAVQDGKEGQLDGKNECALKEGQALVTCGYAAVSRRNPVLKEGRLFCRYCGLSRFHHFLNREHIPTQRPTWQRASVGLVPSLGPPFDPYKYYCAVRCPIHTCTGCRKPFVKTRVNHLCADCRLSNALCPAAARVKGVDHYRDEITQYVQFPTIPVSVKRVSYQGQGFASTVVRELVNAIDEQAAERAIHDFLDRTEYRCHVCLQRFRLSHVRPATIPCATSTDVVRIRPSGAQPEMMSDFTNATVLAPAQTIPDVQTPESIYLKNEQLSKEIAEIVFSCDQLTASLADLSHKLATQNNPKSATSQTNDDAPAAVNSKSAAEQRAPLPTVALNNFICGFCQVSASEPRQQ
jgi:hypothetical protein